MATAHDLAAYILEKQGSMTAMKLQKLCYYSQAYSIAWFNSPIFEDEIQAWTNGPVIRSLWLSHKGQFIVNSVGAADSACLSARDRAVTDAVLDALGGLSGKQLSDRTHSEDPWVNKYDGDDALPNGVITHEEMRDFYGRKTGAETA